ncbi:MAG TPA: acyltransferase [Rhodospirillales bacterium]|jgi:maltose O-acetyltransferase|nr:acyltransferase [Rhodospirillales bacterium]
MKLRNPFHGLIESIFLFLANHLPRLKAFDRYRYLVLRLAGMKIKSRSKIWAPVMVRPIGGCHNITIGSRTFINSEVRFAAPSSSITIGDNVAIGPRCSFETVSHGLLYEAGVGRGTFTKPIVVEDEVWICAGVIILSGVTVGRGAVIAAGSVVASDVKPLCLYGGSPAKLIRELENDIK